MNMLNGMILVVKLNCYFLEVILFEVSFCILYIIIVFISLINVVVLLVVVVGNSIILFVIFKIIVLWICLNFFFGNLVLLDLLVGFMV